MEPSPSSRRAGGIRSHLNSQVTAIMAEDPSDVERCTTPGSLTGARAIQSLATSGGERRTMNLGPASSAALMLSGIAAVVAPESVASRSMSRPGPRGAGPRFAPDSGVPTRHWERRPSSAATARSIRPSASRGWVPPRLASLRSSSTDPAATPPTGHTWQSRSGSAPVPSRPARDGIDHRAVRRCRYRRSGRRGCGPFRPPGKCSGTADLLTCWATPAGGSVGLRKGHSSFRQS